MPLALDDKDFLDAGCTERAFDSLNSARDKYAQDRVLTSKASSSKSFLEASFYEGFFWDPQSGNPSAVWPSADGYLKLKQAGSKTGFY